MAELVRKATSTVTTDGLLCSRACPQNRRGWCRLFLRALDITCDETRAFRCRECETSVRFPRWSKERRHG